MWFGGFGFVVVLSDFVYAVLFDCFIVFVISVLLDVVCGFDFVLLFGFGIYVLVVLFVVFAFGFEFGLFGFCDFGLLYLWVRLDALFDLFGLGSGFSLWCFCWYRCEFDGLNGFKFGCLDFDFGLIWLLFSIWLLVLIVWLIVGFGVWYLCVLCFCFVLLWLLEVRWGCD